MDFSKIIDINLKKQKKKSNYFLGEGENMRLSLNPIGTQHSQ